MHRPDVSPTVSDSKGVERVRLEIWFEFASTYSYLTVSRAERLERRQPGVAAGGHRLGHRNVDVDL